MTTSTVPSVGVNYLLNTLLSPSPKVLTPKDLERINYINYITYIQNASLRTLPLQSRHVYRGR